MAQCSRYTSVNQNTKCVMQINDGKMLRCRVGMKEYNETLCPIVDQRVTHLADNSGRTLAL